MAPSNPKSKAAPIVSSRPVPSPDDDDDTTSALELDSVQDFSPEPEPPESASLLPDSPLLTPADTQPRWLLLPQHQQQSPWSRNARLTRWWRRSVTFVADLLRPRLTWRYGASVVLMAYVLLCLVRGVPLFAHPLPAYTGRYDVGALHARRRFLTSIGTSHPSVSDAPLLEPLLLSWTTGSSLNTKEAMKEYVRVADDFWHFLRTSRDTNTSRSVEAGPGVLDGQIIQKGEMRGVLAEKVTHEQYGEWVSKERKDEFPKAMAELWEVHVSPVSDDDEDESGGGGEGDDKDSIAYRDYL
ncbi:hypothetical protein M440DRAFT_1394531 [Trichoderma longibrachiatum ATCC 18648]|uniref:Uncharacterized protein n=1 Tax=Trichoderma longibrachiatum ATCC 18648 TaxID=983965 RepID=A0A2T4BTP9_TRILO|nr:hypothetical protein M440DRAFT_1394531 [Trichoderma longibrachiatum ATCC 18648]